MIGDRHGRSVRRGAGLARAAIGTNAKNCAEARADALRPAGLGVSSGPACSGARTNANAWEALRTARDILIQRRGQVLRYTLGWQRALSRD